MGEAREIMIPTSAIDLRKDSPMKETHFSLQRKRARVMGKGRREWFGSCARMSVSRAPPVPRISSPSPSVCDSGRGLLILSEGDA